MTTAEVVDDFPSPTGTPKLDDFLRVNLARCRVKHPDWTGTRILVERERPGIGDAPLDSYDVTFGEDIGGLDRKINERVTEDAGEDAVTYWVTVEGEFGRFKLPVNRVVNHAPPGSMVARPRGALGMPGSYASSGPVYEGQMIDPRYVPDNPAATVVGMLVQLVDNQARHNETLMTQLIANQVDTNRMNREVIRELSENQRNADRERVKSIDMLEKLRSENHKRDMEIRAAEFNEKLKEQAISLAVPAVQQLVSHFVIKGKADIEKLTPHLNTLAASFKDFKPEDLEAMVKAGLLDEEKAGALFALFAAMSEIQGRGA